MVSDSVNSPVWCKELEVGTCSDSVSSSVGYTEVEPVVSFYKQKYQINQNIKGSLTGNVKHRKHNMILIYIFTNYFNTESFYINGYNLTNYIINSKIKLIDIEILY